MNQKVLILALVLSLAVNIFFTLLNLNSSRPVPAPTPTPEPIPVESLAPISLPSLSPTSVMQDDSTPPSTRTQVNSPQSYGFTKLIDLPGIGVRAKFKDIAKVTFTDSASSYSVNFGNVTQNITFRLADFNGSSRRSWFSARHPGNYTFDSFSSAKTSGYFVSETGFTGPYLGLYYISLASPTKILTVESQSLVFDNDIQAFKSFLSTIEFITPNQEGVNRPDQTNQNLNITRYSDNRVTLWQNEQYGFKITSPEWIERRGISKFDPQGNHEYTEWSRGTPSVAPAPAENWPEIYKTNFDLLLSVNDGPHYYSGGGLSVKVFKPQYNSYTFPKLAQSYLPNTGFCSSEFHASKTECADPNMYCYTKSDVIANLYLTSSAKIGNYPCQLWRLKAKFDSVHDCRGEDPGEWLIKVGDGSYLLTNISPQSTEVKIEPL